MRFFSSFATENNNELKTIYYETVYIINSYDAHSSNVYNGYELRAGKGESTVPDRQDGIRTESHRRTV